MERSRKRVEPYTNRLIRIAVPLAIGVMALLTACSPKIVGPIPTSTSEHPPTVTPTGTPTPSLFPTSTPTPISTELPTPIPQQISCVYDTGSSSFNRVAEYLFQKYHGERDKTQEYSLITFRETNGNMTVFITKSGAVINFINEVVANKENAGQLPCKPEQVTHISVLIGGNDETNPPISSTDPLTDIVNGLTSMSSNLISLYPNADITLYLPYITKHDNLVIITRKNKVDQKVIQELSGAKKITVIPLSPYTYSNGSVKEGVWADPWHVYPEYLIGVMGGESAIIHQGR